MTRPVTDNELALLRSNGQTSKVYLALPEAPVLYTGMLASIPQDTNDVVVVYYNSGSGDASKVSNGMTMLIGSTPGGMEMGAARVKGIVPVATSGSLPYITIASTSEIVWSMLETYLTIIDEFNIWGKQARFYDGVFLCDDNLPYTDQHTKFAPVPIMGPDAVIKRNLVADAYYHPSAVNSWCINDTIASYLWACEGATVTGATTATPEIYMDNVGTYRLDLTVTSGSGVATTGHRKIYVWDKTSLPETQFHLDSLSGSEDNGGWTAEITMYGDEASVSKIRDRARAIVFSEDYYTSGSSLILGSLGPYSELENILMEGWIDGESIVWNPEQSEVKFTIQGPSWWLQHIGSWPAGIVDTFYAQLGDTEPTNWIFMRNYQADKFIFHLLMFRSTTITCLDWYPSGDIRRFVGSSAPWGDIWDQMKSAVGNTYLISPLCDRYGTLYTQIQTRYVRQVDSLNPTKTRSSIPVVMSIGKSDWTENVNITRRTVGEIALEDLRAFTCSGSAASGSSPTPTIWRSAAPGWSMARYGKMELRTELAVYDQPDCDQMAAILYAEANNKYPKINFTLAQNNRFFDIAPQQYGLFTLVPQDNPREISITSLKVIPTEVSHNWDDKSGMITTTLSVEGVNVPGNAHWMPFDFGMPPGKPDNTSGSTVINPPPIPVPIPITTPCLLDSAPPNGPYNLVGGLGDLSPATSPKLLYANTEPYWIRKSTVAYRSQFMMQATITTSGSAIGYIPAPLTRYCTVLDPGGTIYIYGGYNPYYAAGYYSGAHPKWSLDYVAPAGSTFNWFSSNNLHYGSMSVYLGGVETVIGNIFSYDNGSYVIPYAFDSFGWSTSDGNQNNGHFSIDALPSVIPVVISGSPAPYYGNDGWKIEGLNASGSVVATGVNDVYDQNSTYRTSTFSPALSQKTYSLKLSTAEGPVYSSGSVINSSHYLAALDNGASFSGLTVGQKYCFEMSAAVDSPWYDWQGITPTAECDVEFSYDGVSFSGDCGVSRDNTFSQPSMKLSAPAWGLYCEPIIGTNYGRMYFVAPASAQVFVRCKDHDGDRISNTGGINITLKAVTQNTSDFVLHVTECKIKNICT